jgi:hypothetical protein
MGELLYVGVSMMTGQDGVLHQARAVIAIVVVASAGNAVLSLPLGIVMRWAVGPSDRVAA